MDRIVDMGHRAGTQPESGSVCDITRPAGRGGIEQGSAPFQGAVRKAAVAIGDGIQHRRDEVIAYARREPVSALTAAAGVGLLLGLGVAIGSRAATGAKGSWLPRLNSRRSFLARPAGQAWRRLLHLE